VSVTNDTRATVTLRSLSTAARMEAMEFILDSNEGSVRAASSAVSARISPTKISKIPNVSISLTGSDRSAEDQGLLLRIGCKSGLHGGQPLHLFSIAQGLVRLHHSIPHLLYCCYLLQINTQDVNVLPQYSMSLPRLKAPAIPVIAKSDDGAGSHPSWPSDSHTRTRKIKTHEVECACPCFQTRSWQSGRAF
jgi:hypothetical protein